LRVAGDRYALENAARGRERLNKNSVRVGNLARHRQQVDERQFQEFCVRAITAHDAQYSAIRAMARVTGMTKIASTATGIDFADDARARGQRRRLGC
jgi:hypothetical protein